MGKVAQIYLVGPVGLFEDEEGNISGFTLQSVIAQVQSFKGQDIERYNFKMRGPGGYVDVGEKIFDYMVSLRSNTVSISTEQIGDIASMMTKLFLAADPTKNERRLVLKGAEFMIHNPWGGVEGDTDEIRKKADELEAKEKEMRKFYVAQTDITEAGLDGLMKEETVMTAEEAISLGFATGYVGEVPEPVKAIAMINHNKSKPMSEEKTRFEKIMAAIKGLKDEPKDKALDLTLEGGSVLRIDAENEEGLVGATAMVIDADGNETPAPEGEHVLDDGRTIVIGADNTVMEIKEAADPEEGNEELAKVQKELDELKAEFDKKLDEAVEAKLKEVEKAVEGLQEEKEVIKEEKEQLKAMKTLYKIPENENFVKVLKDKNAPTSYDEAKENLKESRKKKQPFKRGSVIR